MGWVDGPVAAAACNALTMLRLSRGGALTSPAPSRGDSGGICVQKDAGKRERHSQLLAPTQPANHHNLPARLGPRWRRQSRAVCVPGMWRRCSRPCRSSCNMGQRGWGSTRRHWRKGWRRMGRPAQDSRVHQLSGADASHQQLPSQPHRAPSCGPNRAAHVPRICCQRTHSLRCRNRCSRGQRGWRSTCCCRDMGWAHS